MKPYSIRLPERVQEKLKDMDTNYVRKILTEVAGMTYEEEKKLVVIEALVKKYIKENLGAMQLVEEDICEDMADKAIDSIVNIMQ